MARYGGIARDLGIEPTAIRTSKANMRLLNRARSSEFVRKLHPCFKLTDDEKMAIEQNIPKMHVPRLLASINGFAEASLRVNRAFQSKWGIPCLVDRMYISAVKHYGNVAASERRSIFINVGSPEIPLKGLNIPDAIYAHEIGHLLSYYDANGNLQWCGFPLTRYATRLAASSFNGKLKLKYFNDIPYDMFPREALRSSSRLMLLIEETIADKAALQVCGRDVAAKRVKQRLSMDPNTIKDPWLCFQLIFEARVFGFKGREKVFQKKLDQFGSSWDKPLQRDDLLQRLLKFFHGVSLKHQ